MLAAERGKWDIVAILIEHDADVNIKSETHVHQSSNIKPIFTGYSGRTVLMLAVRW